MTALLGAGGLAALLCGAKPYGLNTIGIFRFAIPWWIGSPCRRAGGEAKQLPGFAKHLALSMSFAVGSFTGYAGNALVFGLCALPELLHFAVDAAYIVFIFAAANLP